MDKNVTVLFDFNNLIFRNFFIGDVNAHSEEPDYKLWRYNVINSIYQSLWKNDNTDEVIIAIDDKNSWRKSYFNRYKESRKTQRDKSDVNWENLFNEIDKLSKDIRHYLPFKVIKVRSAEADDIIAVLSLTNKNKDSVIISTDEDYLQLCCDRIRLYNPTKKEYLKCKDTGRFILEKVIMGQKKDDIFNVITPSDWGMTEKTKGKRKPGLGKIAFKKIMDEGVDNWLNKKHVNKLYGEIDIKQNMKRNRILMDFNYIPKVIYNRIIDQYNNYTFPPPSNIYQFFKKNGMRGFLEDFEVVERKLMRLY